MTLFLQARSNSKTLSGGPALAPAPALTEGAALATTATAPKGTTANAKRIEGPEGIEWRLTFELTRTWRQAALARPATMMWDGAARAKVACRGGSRVERGVRRHVAPEQVG